jgi:hypothetical protein
MISIIYKSVRLLPLQGREDVHGHETRAFARDLWKWSPIPAEGQPLFQDESPPDVSDPEDSLHASTDTSVVLQQGLRDHVEDAETNLFGAEDMGNIGEAKMANNDTADHVPKEHDDNSYREDQKQEEAGSRQRRSTDETIPGSAEQQTTMRASTGTASETAVTTKNDLKEPFSAQGPAFPINQDALNKALQYIAHKFYESGGRSGMDFDGYASSHHSETNTVAGKNDQNNNRSRHELEHEGHGHGAGSHLANQLHEHVLKSVLGQNAVYHDHEDQTG